MPLRSLQRREEKRREGPDHAAHVGTYESFGQLISKPIIVSINFIPHKSNFEAILIYRRRSMASIIHQI
jgi:hypothetical protein